MRRRFTILAVLLPVLVGVSADAPPAWAEVVAGNSIYNVHVDDIAGGDGVGTYTITTGSGHSAGGGLNVLYGRGDAWTSANTIRSYTSGTDYPQTPRAFPDPSFSLEPLDAYGSISPIGSTGYRTEYLLPGVGSAPDALRITSDVNVNGAVENDSTVEVTTRVTNIGASAVDIGIRYQWDFQIDFDDGPTFQAESPTGSVLTEEADFGAPAFESYGISDDDSGAPTFTVHGTVNGPATVTPTPTPPERLVYGCWPDSFGTAFGYDIVPGRGVTGGPTDTCGNDSNVMYYWGATPDTAITLDPGETHMVSQSLFLTTSLIPTTLDLNPAVVDVVSPGTQAYLELSGTLTETAGGAPVEGVEVAFTNDGVGNLVPPFDCVGTTDANGFASCGGLIEATDAAALSLGYCAESENRAPHLRATACGPAARVLGFPIL